MKRKRTQLWVVTLKCGAIHGVYEGVAALEAEFMGAWAPDAYLAFTCYPEGTLNVQSITIHRGGTLGLAWAWPYALTRNPKGRALARLEAERARRRADLDKRLACYAEEDAARARNKAAAEPPAPTPIAALTPDRCPDCQGTGRGVPAAGPRRGGDLFVDCPGCGGTGRRNLAHERDVHLALGALSGAGRS